MIETPDGSHGCRPGRSWAEAVAMEPLEWPLAVAGSQEEGAKTLESPCRLDRPMQRTCSGR